MVEVKVPQIVSNTVTTVNEKAIKPAYSLVEPQLNKAYQISNNVADTVNQRVVQPAGNAATQVKDTASAQANSLYNYAWSWAIYGKDTAVKTVYFAKDTAASTVNKATSTAGNVYQGTRANVDKVVAKSKETTAQSYALVVARGKDIQNRAQPYASKLYATYNNVYGKVNNLVDVYVLVPTHKIIDEVLSRFNRFTGRTQAASERQVVAKKEEKKGKNVPVHHAAQH